MSIKSYYSNDPIIIDIEPISRPIYIFRTVPFKSSVCIITITITNICITTLHMRVTNYTNFTLMVLTLLATCNAFQQYCRCSCNDKSIVTKVDRCGLCTKDFCLGLDKALCEKKEDEKGIPDPTEGQVIMYCFQIESYKDSLVIYLFTTLVLGLLGYALFRMYSQWDSGQE